MTARESMMEVLAEGRLSRPVLAKTQVGIVNFLPAYPAHSASMNIPPLPTEIELSGQMSVVKRADAIAQRFLAAETQWKKLSGQICPDKRTYGPISVFNWED